MRQQGISVWRGVLPGSCHVWPLPADATCAAAARRIFREAAGEVGLEPDLLDDCILMASELAANTLHARAISADRELTSGTPPAMTSGTPHARAAQADPPPANSELWLYLRGIGLRRELVCKVFDSSRGWRHGAPPATSRAPWMAVNGRGLQLVEELSSGRWGYHLTRSRLGGWGLRGKSVWFAVPAPLAHTRLVDVTGLRAYTDSADVTAARASEQLSARQAARELEAMLDGRGFGGTLVRDDRPAHDMSILSICRGLTVWCRSGIVSLTTPAGSSHRWQYADLVEAAEQTVRHFEELDLERDLARAQ